MSEEELLQVMLKVEAIKSFAEGRRLIAQGAVSVHNEKLRVGHRNYELPEPKEPLPITRLKDEQEDLDPESEKALHDNLWDLYDSEEPKEPK